MERDVAVSPKPGAWVRLIVGGVALALGVLLCWYILEQSNQDPLFAFVPGVLAAAGVISGADGLFDVLARWRRAPLIEEQAQEAIGDPPESRWASSLVPVVLGLGMVCASSVVAATLYKTGDFVADASRALLVICSGGGCAGLALIGLGLAAGWSAWRRRGQPTAQVAQLGNPWIAVQAPLSRFHWTFLAVLMGVAVALQLMLVDWYIEDAAISFAYARNAALGEGFVSNVGGERVEGFSNPLWTGLMVLWYLVGVNGFTSSKIMAGVFAAITVIFTYWIAREARPHRRDVTPLIAAALLASNAQFAIWGASGLENSLFNVLLAGGIWRVLVEGRSERIRWPISAVFFMLLAITRPEGILYGAIGGFWMMVYTVQTRRRSGDGLIRSFIPTFLWLGTFWIPFIAYHVARYNYFAYELPNTYYAKSGRRRFNAYGWNLRAWRYLRRYAHELWQGYLIPVYLFGLLGMRRNRGLVATIALLFLGVVLLFPGTDTLKELPFWPDWKGPPWWVRARVWVIGGLMLGLPLAAIGRRGWRAVVLCWWMISAALFFSLWSTGDWMKGFRWMSMLAVPASVLFAVGLAELSDQAHRLVRWAKVSWFQPLLVVIFVLMWLPIVTWLSLPRFDLLPRPSLPAVDLVTIHLALLAMLAMVYVGWRRGFKGHPDRWQTVGLATAVFFTGFAVVPQIHHLDWFTRHRETGPFSVKRRVKYMQYVQERIHLEHAIGLDVDQGAHLYWSGFHMLDIAGLVDVSMGHHRFEKPFIREYIFEEKRPHFAHVHGAWAGTSKIPTHSEWKRDYFEVPGYPTGKSGKHVGNHIRRELLITADWQGPQDRTVRFADGVTLVGWERPGAQVSPGRAMFIEVAWHVRDPKAQPSFRTLMFLSDDSGVVASWDVAPGYDWYKPDVWDVDEIIFGKYSLEVPKDVPQGTYDLGFVLLDAEGRVLHVLTEEDAAEPPPPTKPNRTPPKTPLAIIKGNDSEEFVGPLPESPTDFSRRPLLPAAAVVGGRDEVPARFAKQEVRFESAVTVISPEDLDSVASGEVDTAVQTATAGKCEVAEAAWRRARRLQTRRAGWLAKQEERAHPALAACWAETARTAEREDAVAALERGHAWDHWEPTLLEVTAPLADELYAEGLAAHESRDWETAYRRFDAVLRIQPTRAWARRYAEEARDYRLKLDDETKARKEQERQDRRDKAARERLERVEKRKEMFKRSADEKPDSIIRAAPKTP